MVNYLDTSTAFSRLQDRFSEITRFDGPLLPTVRTYESTKLIFKIEHVVSKDETIPF